MGKNRLTDMDQFGRAFADDVYSEKFTCLKIEQ